MPNYSQVKKITNKKRDLTISQAQKRYFHAGN